MVAAAVVGSAVVGGVVATNSAGKAANASTQAAQMASNDSAAQLAFQKQQYADMKPTIDALNKQAIAGNAQQQQIAQQEADRSQTAWQQNQQATQGAVGQMGLNALGAQYLSPEQTQQLIGLQQTMATGTPAQKAAAQQQLAQLQKTAETNAIGLEQAKANTVLNTSANQGQQVQAAYNQNAASTQQIGQQTAAGLADIAKTYGNQTIALGDQDANQILANGQTMQDAYTQAGLDRLNQQQGFYNDQAQQLQATAKQRAADFERDATTQANANIANAADQAQRAMLRVGGDPNKMAALALDTANQQQLARIGAGNQVAATNIANLNAADDQARTLQQTGFNAGTAQQYALGNAALSTKSSALDAARQSRTDAAATALGMNANAATQGLSAVTSANQSAADKTLAGTTAAQQLTFAGQNQADQINNNAKDKVDAGLNSLQQGTANYGAGFANTSGQAAQTATSATSAGVNGLATAVNSTTGSTSGVNQAYGNAVNAANAVNNTSQNILKAGQAQGNAIAGIGSSLAGYLSSSKKVKQDRQPVDYDAALEGLEDAAPQTYDYKPGMGPTGRKIGPMAEDMQEQFGDDVAPGGKAISVQNTLGLHHAAIIALKRKVEEADEARKLPHRKAA